MTPIYVVIPVKNQLHYTKGIVSQLLEQGEAERIFVYDNGSTDGTSEWLDGFGSESVVVGADGDGHSLHEMWNGGLDLAMGYAAGEPHDVAILNNDLRIGPRFLSSLSTVLRADPCVGVVGANYDGRDFGCHAEMVVRSICANRYDGTGGLPGFAFMVRGEDGYRFPTDLVWWCGDNDLLLTVLASRRVALLVRDAVCEHLDGGGGTGKWDDPALRPVLERDIARFRAKWGL